MFRTALAVAAIAFALPAPGLAQTVDELVARNIEARGGQAVWRAVSSLQLAGRMSVGRGTFVPYVLDQQRPQKMRFEFVLNGQTFIQTSDGEKGWTLEPFRTRDPEPMATEEVRELAPTADPWGLLFDYAARKHVIELVGEEKVRDHNTYKLKVTMPGSVVRWVYLDTETGLEVKVEAVRKLRGRMRRVETYYHEWRPADGLLMARRYEVRTEGARKGQTLTVAEVRVNPKLDDSRFGKPPPAPARVASAAPAGKPRGK
jgi:outer membrane lipoprotein-sorting protein